MKPKDVFGIIVRLLGLISLGYGLQYLLSWTFMTLRQSASPAQGWGGPDYLIIGLIYIPLGLFLLRGAPYVINFAYPRESNEQKTPDHVA